MFIWLASYPKSGNTWLRLFLESVSRNGGEVDINDLNLVQSTARRDRFDAFAGLSSQHLSLDEIDELRPLVLAAEASLGGAPQIRKVHDAWRKNDSGRPLFPAEITQASVLLVRDPRDVALSLANHLGQDVDRIIDSLNDDAYVISRADDGWHMQLPQRVSSWSGHTASWLDARPAPLVVRYEDMLQEPARWGAAICGQIGWQTSAAAIERAIEATGFDRLRQQEEANGFRERISPDRRFFNRGTAGGWRAELSPDQARRIEHRHSSVMRRLSYLDSPNTEQGTA